MSCTKVGAILEDLALLVVDGVVTEDLIDISSSCSVCVVVVVVVVVGCLKVVLGLRPVVVGVIVGKVVRVGGVV